MTFKGKKLDLLINAREARVAGRSFFASLAVFAFLAAAPACAVDGIEGQILGAGAPSAKSTATLCLRVERRQSSWLRLNPAIALISAIGSKSPAHVVIKEFTTVGSVVTLNQYIDGTAIEGSALALNISAGNVPNFVDFPTGGYSATIQDLLNSAQTPTMLTSSGSQARFATAAFTFTPLLSRAHF